MLARESGWVDACKERIEQLRRDKLLFPEITGKEKIKRDGAYGREIAQWKRKLFWAKYGHIRAAIIGIVLGWVLSATVLDPFLDNLFS